MLLALMAGVVAILGLAAAGFLAYALAKQKVEDKRAEVIAAYIKEGALVFLFKEYRILAVLVAVVAIIIAALPGLSWKTAVAFIFGAVLSMAAGFIGMRVATLANVRTAEKFRQGLAQGLKTAFTSGSVMGLSVVSLGLLGVTVLYLVFRDPNVIYGFGFGASAVALFARVGGGIYTKAADVGADLAGKLEQGMPEDDLRNPAVIANAVGDNVGDVAGLGADLFESYVDSIIAAIALGAIFWPLFGTKAVVLPLLLAAAGLLASVLGNLAVFFIKSSASRILNFGVWLSALAMLILSFLAIKLTINDLGVFWALLVGLLAGVAIGLAAEYYTSDRRRPARNVALASQTGTATNIIAGLASGLMSTIVPVLAVVVAIYFANSFAGLYGVAISAVGMLSTLGIVLANNAHGPVIDNAAAIVRLAEMGAETRERTEELDAVGNTTAAIGKGFAIGSAALTTVVLLVAFGQAVNLTVINLLETKTLIGLLIGGVLPFAFCALAMRAVSRAAGKMVEEVRRQFSETAGIMSGETEPDYKKCINISTGAALRRMIAPGLLALVAPVVVGKYLGVESLAGLLAGATVTAFMLAVFMASSGGVWDNAKKFIEAGNLGGKGSEAHKAAVIGDTVGDPLKDTAGPALNILIKLMAIISIVIAPLLMMR
ncbi:MAG: sodium-translocating pyrophosphatase [Patescibacteria group bacterium]